MKALIIENEYDVDESVKAFVKDNPTLFESIHEETFVRHKKLRDLYPLILDADAIIVASTFGTEEREQTLEYLEAFLSPQFTKKMKLFVHRFTRELNEWSYERMSWLEGRKLFDIVKMLVTEKGFELYDFFEDWDSEVKITDDLNFSKAEKERDKFNYFKMEYSPEHGLFYVEKSSYYNLKNVIKERTDYLKRSGK